MSWLWASMLFVMNEGSAGTADKHQALNVITAFLVIKPNFKRGHVDFARAAACSKREGSCTACVWEGGATQFACMTVKATCRLANSTLPRLYFPGPHSTT